MLMRNDKDEMVNGEKTRKIFFSVSDRGGSEENIISE